MPKEIFKRKLHTEETKAKMKISRQRIPSRNKGKHWKVSIEGRNNMRLAHLNMSDETKRKIGLANIGKQHALGKHWKQSAETIAKRIKSRTGIKSSPETRKKLSESHKGYKMPESQRLKISIANRGENSYLWKGGVSKDHRKQYCSFEYRKWRRLVFERDNHTCQLCGDKTGGNLNAHHIKRYIDHPQLRFDVDNGVTFCEYCHRQIHRFPIAEEIALEQELRKLSQKVA